MSETPDFWAGAPLAEGRLASSDRQHALEAARELADWVFRRVLVLFAPEELESEVTRFRERLESSATISLLCDSGNPPGFIGALMDQLVHARALQIQQERWSAWAPPDEAADAKVQAARRIVEAAGVLAEAKPHLRVELERSTTREMTIGLSSVMWQWAGPHGRSQGRQRGPLREFAEGVDALVPTVPKSERDRLIASLAVEVLGIECTQARVDELMRTPRRDRTKENPTEV